MTFFPEAKHYYKAHDFHFFEITPLKVHFIQDFGKIFTFSGNEFIQKPVFSEEEEKEAISHMNEDHQSFLLKLALQRGFGGSLMEEAEVKLLRINREGFFLSLKKDFCYISFQKPVSSFKDLRKAFKELLL